MQETSPSFERYQVDFIFMQQVPVRSPGLKVGVVGATGVVGRTLIGVLAQRGFPVEELHLFASRESSDRWVETPFGQCHIDFLNPQKPPLLNVAFIAAGADVARFWGWRLARRGALVIDKSSYFRDKDYAPLVVPEVNADALKEHRNIIANPNCTTIPMVMALAPLHKAFGLKRVAAVSLQSVSGAGRDGMISLERELADQNAKPTVFAHRIAYNVIPNIGGIENGFSGEESKIIHETRRIMGIRKLPVRVTAVRVPTLVSHAVAIHADFRKSVSVTRVHEILSNSPGLRLAPDADGGLPTPLDAAGNDSVWVGRIRRDRGRTGLALWVVSDNLRKGAAVNAVQIAESALKLRSA